MASVSALRHAAEAADYQILCEGLARLQRVVGCLLRGAACAAAASTVNNATQQQQRQQGGRQVSGEGWRTLGTEKIRDESASRGGGGEGRII